jgi:predicted XRE-type DNA-binding protein
VGADDEGKRVEHIDWRLAAACFVPNSGAVFIRHRQLTIPSRDEQWQCVCGPWAAQCGRAGDEGAARASLNAILAERKLTQAETARLLGVNQPKVSALKGYKLEGFSVERLMHFATALEHDVVIEIRPHAAAEGAARVMVVGVA